MKKYSPTLFSTSVILATGYSALAQHSENTSPNVIIIYTDDLGYGDLSCYGASQIKTPNIDNLANNGLRFTNGYATASTSTPSRFSLLTGHLPFRKKGTGILPGDAKLIIQPGSQTLPAVMKKAGYTTACVGKWHLGLGSGKINWNGHVKPGPNEVGFDYSFIIPATNDRVPCVYLENGRVANLDPNDPLYVDYKKKVGNDPTGWDHPELMKQKLRPRDHHHGTIHGGIGRIGYMAGGKSARWDDETMADDLVAKANKFIKDNKEKPFFLYLSTADVHAPRLFNPRFAGKSGLGARGDMVLQLDDCVGQLMKVLKNEKLIDNTLIIFSSDNGPKLEDSYLDGSYTAAMKKDFKPAGSLRGTKYTAFEGGVRVPFIVHWPGKVKVGVSDAIISQVDLLASLGHFTNKNFTLQRFSDSQNHLSALLGENPTARQSVIGVGGWRGIIYRKGDWKLINTKKPQLYNLKNDLGETQNLAPKYPERVKALQQDLQTEMQRYKL